MRNKKPATREYAASIIEAHKTAQIIANKSEDPESLVEDGSVMTLDRLIEILGQELSVANQLKGSTRLAKIAEIQPLFLKAVESKDRTDLAAKKLGIDSLEMIPRDKFVKLIRVIAWALVQHADNMTCRIANSTAGLKTPAQVYEAVHPIVFHRMFEDPLMAVSAHSTQMEVPDWTLETFRETINDAMQDGEKVLDRFLKRYAQ
jgi:hypothetical protein